MCVQQPLRLLCIEALLVHVSPELVSMHPQHIHCSVVRVLTYVLVHDRC